MPDDSRNVEAFQACLRAPFATLGIATTNTHVTGIRFLAPSVAAKAPARNTIAFLACVQIQSYLDDPARRAATASSRRNWARRRARSAAPAAPIPSHS